MNTPYDSAIASSPGTRDGGGRKTLYSKLRIIPRRGPSIPEGYEVTVGQN